MLIDAYKKKYNWYFVLYKFVYRFRILLLTILIVLGLASVTLISIKGKVTDTILINNEITYGDELTYSSKALLSDYMHYEFKDSDGNWSRNEPTLVGSYEIRGVSKNIFGGYRYGKSHRFSIAKKPITISFNDTSSVYGEKLTQYSASLAYNDSIIYHEFRYSSLDNENLKATYRVDKSSIVINSSEGNDVTSCYKISVEDKDISLSKRTLYYETPSKSKEYDGSSISSTSYNNVTNLYNNDKIDKVTSYKEMYIGGKELNELNFKIINEYNRNVTNFYSLSISNDSTLEITKRNINIETYSDSKIYDGKQLKKESFKLINSTSLINGDSISIVFPSLTEAGKIDNKPVSYKIKNRRNEDVTSSYNISWSYGTLNILKRELTIKTNSSSFEYDSYLHKSLSYSLISGTLADGDMINVDENDSSNSFIKYVGEKNNILNFHFYNKDFNEVTSSYEISLISGTLSIYKRKISILTSSDEFAYDGEYHNLLSVEITSGSIADNDELIYKEDGSTNEKKPGTYKNIVSFDINNKEDNISSLLSYDITLSYGEITITGKEDEGSEDNPGGDDEKKEEGGDDQKKDEGGVPFTREDIDTDAGFDQMAGFDKEVNQSEEGVFSYISTTSGYKYFRNESFLDYSSGELSKDTEYNEKNEKYGNPNFTLVNNLYDKTITDIEIIYKANGSNELIPMYSTINPLLTDYKNNANYERKNIKNWQILEYDYLTEGSKNLTNKLSYSDEYIDFVYDNYLTIGNRTLNKLTDWLNSQNFVKYNKDGSLNIYDTSIALHQYFKLNYKYSLDDLVIDDDYPVENFILETNEGYCTFFATATMLIYRMLGVPARVADGFLSEAKANEETIVVGKQAHAWTEVFLKDYGWVYIDNTVSSNGQNGGEGEEDEKIEGDLIIKSSDNNFTYDGTYHNDLQYSITKNTLGDKVEIIYNNYIKIKDVGEIDNDFEILLKIDGKIIDYENNEDITVIKDIGKLKVNPRPLKVTTSSITKVGGNISSSESPLTNASLNGLANGDTLGEVTYISSISKKGSVKNIVIIKSILDCNGNNVISNYDINYEYGNLTIN